MHRLVGQRFGRLVVVRREGSIRRYASWLCRCDCGNDVIVRSDKLLRGAVRCGRCRKDMPEGKALAYKSWLRMRSRCGCPTNHRFLSYGGRGINLCAEWAASFERFYADMGDRPSVAHSVERLDVNGDYEPSNCIWATNEVQQKNRRDTIYVEHLGVRWRLVDLCSEMGLASNVVRSRLRVGWPLERALTEPVRGR